jgi:hypothetical protein
VQESQEVLKSGESDQVLVRFEDVSFEAFTTVIFQVKIFRVVTPCSVVFEFEDTCVLGEKINTTKKSTELCEMLVWGLI